MRNSDIVIRILLICLLSLYFISLNVDYLFQLLIMPSNKVNLKSIFLTIYHRMVLHFLMPIIQPEEQLSIIHKKHYQFNLQVQVMAIMESLLPSLLIINSFRAFNLIPSLISLIKLFSIQNLLIYLKHPLIIILSLLNFIKNYSIIPIILQFNLIILNFMH